MFNLAVDVIAMLGAVIGLSDGALAGYEKTVRVLDRHVADRAWSKSMRKAGAGPAAFRELRIRIPITSRGDETGDSRSLVRPNSSADAALPSTLAPGGRD
jgi:hypothetical protein